MLNVTCKSFSGICEVENLLRNGPEYYLFNIIYIAYMHHTKSHPIIAVKQHRTVFIEHGAGIPIVEFVCLRKKNISRQKKKHRYL